MNESNKIDRLTKCLLFVLQDLNSNIDYETRIIIKADLEAIGCILPEEHELILSNLNYDHPLRNTSLYKIKAQHRWMNGTSWKVVEKHWKIANSTYNQLGEAWTASSIWRVDI